MVFRGGPRTAATSTMERFVIIVNGFQSLTIITKSSILEVAAVLDPALVFTWVLSKCLKIKISLRTVAIKNEIRIPKLELNDVLLKSKTCY